MHNLLRISEAIVNKRIPVTDYDQTREEEGGGEGRDWAESDEREQERWSGGWRRHRPVQKSPQTS